MAHTSAVSESIKGSLLLTLKLVTAANIINLRTNYQSYTKDMGLLLRPLTIVALAGIISMSCTAGQMGAV